jgi:hypothetical protein
MERTNGEPDGQKHEIPKSFFYEQSTWTASRTKVQTPYKLPLWAKYMKSQNDTGTNFLPASFIGRAQGHEHRLLITSFHGKSTWTAKEEHRLPTQL